MKGSFQSKHMLSEIEVINYCFFQRFPWRDQCPQTRHRTIFWPCFHLVWCSPNLKKSPGRSQQELRKCGHLEQTPTGCLVGEGWVYDIDIHTYTSRMVWYVVYTATSNPPKMEKVCHHNGEDDIYIYSPHMSKFPFLFIYFGVAICMQLCNFFVVCISTMIDSPPTKHWSVHPWCNIVSQPIFHAITDLAT